MTEDVKSNKGKRACPYCEGEILASELPFCKPCDVILLYCPVCEMAVEREATICPQCGGKLEWK